MTDHLIFDNVMVNFETLHYMRNNSLGSIGYMVFKLDMSKAYDKVEWQYVEKLMKKMGFANTWVRLIMECISSSTYSILINGKPHGNIIPTRAFDKATPFHLIYSCCVQRVSMDY